MKKIRHKTWLQLGSVFLLALVLMGVMAPQAAEARSLQFTELKIEAEILYDGSLAITEYRTASFSGTYNGMYQWINKAPGVTIENVSVGETGKPYRFIPGATTYGPADTFYVVDEGRRLYIDWSYAATDETRTFIISYKVLGQVRLHEDVAELYYQFVGDQWDYGVQKVVVTLTLPEGAQQSEIRAWGHGPLNGEVEIVSPRQVVWSLEKLPERTFLEGRVAFPKGLITGEYAQPTHKPALEQILAEEGKLADQANRSRRQAAGGLAVAIVSPILAIIWAVRGWRLGGRAHTTTFDGDYYRELPGQYSPAELAVLWRFGDPTTDDFTATLLDLARRGYLRIEETVVDKKGLFRSGSETSYYLTRQEKDPADLARHEADAFEFIFTTVAQAGNKQAGADRVSFEQIEAYAKKHASSFRSFWQGWVGLVRYETERHQFFDKGPEIKRARKQLWLGALLAIILILPAAAFAPLALFGLIPAALILVLVAASLNRRSRGGQEDYVRWQAFQRFLQHFSQMERYTIPSLVVWEHYLVYAVTLGVAKEVMKQLELVYPNLSEGDYRFGYGWYYWPMGRSINPLGFTNSFTSLSNTMSQSMRAATSTSSSRGGFGGGFSGGGGFGGGGGGGGAR